MKSYFTCNPNVIIPFNAVIYTIDHLDGKLKVSFGGNSLTISDKERFIEEYTAWLDYPDSPKTLT